MSTRANVKIVTTEGETGYNTLWLYKHHDGYPTHTGDILEFVFTNNKVKNAVNALTTKHKFETTTEQHGDINWLYDIKVIDDEWDIEITEFHYDGNDKVRDARFSSHGKSYEVWTKYKIYESKCAIEEAKHRLDYYSNKFLEV